MRQFGQRCWRIPEISTWYEQTLNEVVDRLLLPIFLFSSYPFFIVIQVFTIHFPSVCDLCSFSQIFASGWLDTLQRWLELSSHWFDHLEGLPGISLLSSLLPIPRTCLLLLLFIPLSFLCNSTFSSWYRFLSLPFASLFSLTAAKVSSDIHLFLFRD